MKLTLDTLEAARLTASPSDAMTLADALTDLSDLADVLAALGMTLDDVLPDLSDLADVLAALGMTLDDVLPALGERRALRDHVRAQPFETTAMDDGTTVVDDVTPGSFADWLATLESLAQ
jgi:antitoxin component of RelBE/YafQ-DinJ toxin-antitoxin module